MRLKLVHVLVFLILFFFFAFLITHNHNVERRRQLYEIGQKSLEPESFLLVKEELRASRYSNSSLQFREKFCQYELKIEKNPKICVYDVEEDIYVSKNIVERGIWDPNGVSQVMKVLHRLKDAGNDPIFIDLGANIGDFSLAALSAGIPTISVEPMASAMTRLATSVDLNHLSDLSLLVRAGVSDRRSGACLEVTVDRLNKGGSVVGHVACASHVSEIRSVTLDDLLAILPEESRKLVLKIDIQGFEPFAILSGARLFATHDVPFIYLEWSEMKQALQTGADERYNINVHNAMEFLLHHMEYSVYDHESLKQLFWEDHLNWPNNIYLAREEDMIK